MLAPALLAVALFTVPVQDAVAWGQYEWDYGAGSLSRHGFENGTEFPSGYWLEHATQIGSLYQLMFATGPGSSYFWNNGVQRGSAYFWRHGREAGSRYHWQNGRGCLSDFGWRNGASCSIDEVLVFQTLCIAQAIDVDPCRTIGARVDDWLSRGNASTFRTGGSPSEVIARMREAVD